MKVRIICEVEIDDEPYTYTDEETGKTFFVGPTDPMDRALNAFGADPEDYIVEIEKIS